MGKRTVSFNKIRDVINNTDIPNTRGGPAAREAIRNRYPGTISIELPGLKKYPGGATAPVVYDGTIYVPKGTPCPTPGTK